MRIDWSYRPHLYTYESVDIHIRRLSVTAKGIFHELLDIQWQEGSLPAEEDSLRAILRCSDDEWSKFAPHLDTLFPLADGQRRNVRYYEVQRELEQRREVNKRNGRLGGRPKKVQNETETKPNGYQEETERLAKHNRSETETEPKRNQIKEKEKEKENKKETVKENTVSASGFAEFFATYPERNTSKRHLEMEIAYNKALKRATHEEIMAGLHRYVSYVEAQGLIGSKYVKTAQRWLEESNWEQDYSPLAVRPSAIPLKTQEQAPDPIEGVHYRKGLPEDGYVDVFGNPASKEDYERDPSRYRKVIRIPLLEMVDGVETGEIFDENEWRKRNGLKVVNGGKP